MIVRKVLGYLPENGGAAIAEKKADVSHKTDDQTDLGHARKASVSNFLSQLL